MSNKLHSSVDSEDEIIDRIWKMIPWDFDQGQIVAESDDGISDQQIKAPKILKGMLIKLLTVAPTKLRQIETIATEKAISSSLRHETTDYQIKVSTPIEKKPLITKENYKCIGNVENISIDEKFVQSEEVSFSGTDNGFCTMTETSKFSKEGFEFSLNLELVPLFHPSLQQPVAVVADLIRHAVAVVADLIRYAVAVVADLKRYAVAVVAVVADLIRHAVAVVAVVADLIRHAVAVVADLKRYAVAVVAVVADLIRHAVAVVAVVADLIRHAVAVVADLIRYAVAVVAVVADLIRHAVAVVADLKRYAVAVVADLKRYVIAVVADLKRYAVAVVADLKRYVIAVVADLKRYAVAVVMTWDLNLS
ncbi:hypothetical protein HPULCUR_004659 [Helicostylum pulchrum]|uniref:Uncharacterized protein n=1 Tax=Helicostylum pulchrum TaxID=562976 RepID=A0ABP9XWW9_9FUNG